MSRPRTDRLRYYTWYTKNNKRNSSPNPSPNLMFPKVVAFETSGVLFSGDLRKDVWGKGPGASKTLANNVEQVSERVLRDKSNSQNTVELYEDIPRIIHHVLQSGAALAIVSRTQSKDLSDRVLYFFHAIDPKTNVGKPIIKMVKYDEVVDEPKIKHFGRIQGWHKCTYKDIIYFDNAIDEDLVQQGLKMTTTDHKGLTWPQYNQSIALWRGENLTPEPTEPLKELKIAHFNDVYKVSDQSPADDPKGKKINVSKFATLLSNVRKAWKASGHGDGLTIFSGDIFSPSPHSTISRGRHMVHVANALKIDIGVIGNHEFDFGVHQLFELIKETKFPWLLSNIIDKDTGTVPVPLKEYHVLETSGVRVGFVGLVEKGWLETIVGLPASYEWQSMTEIGLKLSQILRDPSGPHKCDLVIALTHSRVPDDIRLARELFALSPKAQAGIDITSKHGVDLLLGGHDHFYWISKGVSSWEKYNLDEKRPEAEGDQGDTLVVKSGTDFQDLSEITLGLKATPAGSVRRMIIASIKGKRCITSGDLADDQDMVDTIQSQFANINASLPMPICFTEVDLPLVSRTEESVLGNWIADCLKPVYDDVLRSTQRNPVDGVLILTGDIRGGNYPKGPLTLENLLEIVPYGDSMIVLEISGKDLWTAVESSLSKYPKTEGRFPAISGFRVDWKSKNPVGSRVQGIWLQGEPKRGADGKTKLVDKEEVGRSSDRKYTIAVGYYMYQGGDGYDVLKNQTVLLGEENGDTKANLVRKFLLGAHYVNKVSHDPEAAPKDLQPETFSFVSQARVALRLPPLHPSALRTIPQGRFPLVTIELPGGGHFVRRADRPNVPALDPELSEFIQEGVVTFKWTPSAKVLSFALNVALAENVNTVDPYERQRQGIEVEGAVSVVQTRAGAGGDILASMADGGAGSAADLPKKSQEVRIEKDLPRIAPTVDGRLRDLDRVAAAA